MEELFKNRRRNFLEQTSKYLRYVLNDHFVLVLMILLGFILVQYRTLLNHFPKNPIPIWITLTIVLIIFLGIGNIASYVEKSDKQFLAVKEEELIKIIKQSTLRSFIFWSIIQILVLLVLVPIFMALGLVLFQIVLIGIALLVIKYMLFKKKESSFFNQDVLDWDKLISYELKRKQSILKFYSLFTTVKGITTSVKRRRYLDRLLIQTKQKNEQVWLYLFLRAFLRSGDYLGLTLRLVLLSLMSLLFISNTVIAVGLAILFNYLLLFQLLSLYHHFDYHYLNKTYPIENSLKAKNLIVFLQRLSVIILVIELPFTLSFVGVSSLIVATLILNQLYLRYKVKQMID